MPMLPLFVPPDARAAGGAWAGAWHRVTAPGGYEWWSFDAEDATGGVRLVAGLFDGCPFHPGYLRAHARYLRRPTRVAPAVPSQYPCASLAVYEGGRVLARFTTRYPAGAFGASDHRPEVRVGPNVLQRTAGGALRLELADGPVAAVLTFRPLPQAPLSPVAPRVWRRFLSREMTGADHQWLIANPLCDVEGTVGVPAAGATGARTVAFRGRGYHDHAYGTGPLAGGVRRWVRGRVLLADRTIAFHWAQPANPGRPDELCLVTADASGQRDAPDAAAAWEGGGRTGTGLAYPRRLRIGGAAGRDSEVGLHNPRVLDASAFAVRVAYDAGAAGERGSALCEVTYPPRLRNPVIGRLIERSIGRGRPAIPP